VLADRALNASRHARRRPIAMPPPSSSQGTLLAMGHEHLAFVSAGFDEHTEITAFLAAEYQFAVLVHEGLASLGRLEGRTIACFDTPDLPFAPHDFLPIR
jgi:hypothetical protein